MFQSWVTVQMKEFLYWFVQAKGILNLFPEMFDFNPEGDEEDQVESTQYRRYLKSVVRERNDWPS